MNSAPDLRLKEAAKHLRFYETNGSILSKRDRNNEFKAESRKMMASSPESACDLRA